MYFMFFNEPHLSFCPHLSQYDWYSLSKVILQLGQTQYALLCKSTLASVTIVGMAFLRADCNSKKEYFLFFLLG